MALLCLTAACSTQHTTYAPDGRQAYAIDCDGYLNSFASCLVKAGRACASRGYDTISGGEDERRLLIACKAPK
jgi:hypothetical protein